MRVVIDTNVVASAYISPRSNPARVIEMFWAGQFDLVTLRPILDEYAKILLRPRIQKRHLMTPAQIVQVVDLIRYASEYIESPLEVRIIVADPDDDKFLACAVAGKADRIVSGDAHLLDLGSFRDIPILTPAAFLHWMDHSTDNE